MSDSTDYLTLEALLCDVQCQIQERGVLQGCKDLRANAEQSQSLLARHDVIRISEYCEHFHTPLRKVALLCLQLSGKMPSPADCEPLILGSLQAGLHHDVLQLVDQLGPADCSVIAIQCAIQASYRLGLWPEILRYASLLPASGTSVGLQLMVARAHLQVGRSGVALALLDQPQPASKSEQRQHQILQLLARNRLGLLSRADLMLFLSLFPNASAAEQAALASLWPAAEAWLTQEEINSSTLYIALRQFWSGICSNTVLVDGFRALPTLRPGSSIVRLAVVVAESDQLPFYEKLMQALDDSCNGSMHLQLLMIYPGAIDLSSSFPCLNLYGHSVSEMLREVRELQLDVLIDTIGFHDARWLEVLAQRVAALQIGWLEPNLTLLQASPYDAIVVDRWTRPSECQQRQVGLLQLSGLSVLSHPSVLPQYCSSSRADPLDHLQLVVLGSPQQMLQGSALLLSQIIEQLPAITIGFLDPAWSEPGLLEAWWSAEQLSPLPKQFQLIPNVVSLMDNVPCCSLGLSLNHCSPTNSALHLISMGIPIVCLASQLQGIQPMRGLLEALGLQAFVAADPQHFLAILVEWTTQPELRRQLSKDLPNQLATSLVMDLDLFASDLLKGLPLLMNAA